LRQEADAEDAFQATFLVLARKAGALSWNESIAGWLHDTARRTSLKLRSSTARRGNVERLAAQRPVSEATSAASDPSSQATVQELSEILDEELARLPSKYREVILLSQVEGLGRDEMATRLGITAAAVKNRLERGREQLRVRLVKRGVTLSAVAVAAWLVPGTTQAAGSVTLITGTAQAAGAFATGKLAAGTVPAAVTLAQGVLKMMGFEKLKIVAACMVSMLTAGTIVYGMLQDEPTRFEKGLRGQIVAVNVGKPSTVTISLEEFGTLLNLDVSGQAKVWTAFEAGQLADLKEGQFVSLRLGNDHRTVNEIHVQGQIRVASIKSIAASGKIVIVEGDDDEDGAGKPMEVELAPDAILRIGGLRATRDDLKPGMQVPLEFGRDGKLVNAIEAEAPENSLVEGELLEVDAAGNKLVFGGEGEDDKPVQQSFTINAETIITLDGKPAKLADIKKGSLLRLRLSDDGKSIRVIKATSPELDDDDNSESEDK
jgi:RNA polymerase sigma factor (sigma-70 family)